MPRRACVWRSMNPGATTRPPASMTRAAGVSIRGAMRAIVSPRTARSPRYHGLPVPSTIRALRMRRSKEAGACARGTIDSKTSSRIGGKNRMAQYSRWNAIKNLEFGIKNSSSRCHAARRPTSGARSARDAFQIPNSTFLIACDDEADRVTGGVAHQKPAVDRFDRDLGSPNAEHHVGDGRLGREQHVEVVEADGAGRRRRRADAGPRVQPDVVMVAAGRNEQRARPIALHQLE